MARTHRIRALLLAASVGLLAAPAPALARSHQPPTPGAAGVGDRLFPTLGNGGYDVLHYDVDARYATAAPTQAVDGTVTLYARATQSLSSFDLDWAGTSVGAISVNGRPATSSQVGEDLVITPRRPIREGRRFKVRVEHYSATPVTPDPTSLLAVPFIATPDGSVTAGQPDGTHDFLPSNDHPSDKATYSFRFDVPAGTKAIANGRLTGHWAKGDREYWAYEMDRPLATELVQMAVGNWDITLRGLHDGVFVRDVTSPTLSATVVPDLADELEHLDFMQQRVGRYPFDVYGSLVVDADFGFALETQTLSLYDRGWFQQYPRGVWSTAMLHELAHQWFGDSVAPASWSDLWQNEGHATWYEFQYAASKGYLADDTGVDGVTTVDELMKLIYALGDQWRHDDGPVAAPLSGDPEQLFSIQVYFGGALALYALQQKIGAAAFDRLERVWVRKYRDGVASTHDFIDLASRVSGQDLTAFLEGWLYGTTTPPMPGHPDWTVNPVVVTPAATASALSTSRSAFAPLRRR